MAYPLEFRHVQCIGIAFLCVDNHTLTEKRVRSGLKIIKLSQHKDIYRVT